MKKILILGLFLLPSMALASIDINLKYGARGTEVTELQEFLIDKGFLTGTATGNFFSLTRKAVVAYQVSVGLPNTGFVGILTRNKINTELSTADASSTQAEITETGTTTQPTNTNQLAILNQQIAELNKKLEEQKQIQRQTQNTLQQTQQSVQQIQQNTTPTPYVPPPVISNVKKEVKVTSGCTSIFPGTYCDIEVSYFENGKRVNTESVTVSSNDTGIFIESSYPGNKCIGSESANSDGTQRKGNPLTCPTRPSPRDGMPVALFTYLPSSIGTRILTATINGITATTESQGQIEQCAGKVRGECAL